ncbi:hypothetical protein FB567DRAFT_541209 [Paraphoma chrysanthemicola]|uniref:Uncharacterized protein n=1 Tax=Paraphoma chrysanthemicola TaxID=798071 RepID=A0A8K0QSM2_9PLEO|nr:hypothetical protein FB567DRAFT_541209 [Paraphoma chrysanthemicola]
MSSPRFQRIEANCKIIWGNDSDYDIDAETDDWEYYSCVVKKDYGTAFRPPLTMTGLCPSSDAALAELDRMLGLWAKQVVRGTDMTKDEMLSIFGGRKGEKKGVLGSFIGECEKRG